MTGGDPMGTAPDHQSAKLDSDIRAQMRQLYPLEIERDLPLDELRHAVQRARRKRYAIQSLGAAVALIVVAALVLPLSRLASTSGSQIQVAAVASNETPPGDEGTRSSMSLARDQSPTSSPASSPTVSSSPLGSGSAGASGETSTSELGSEPPADPLRIQLGSDEDETTIPGPLPATITLATACGDLEIGYSGSALSIVDVRAEPGVETETESGGPSAVEVEFEGPGGHCHLTAELDGISLNIHSQQEAGDDDD